MVEFPCVECTQECLTEVLECSNCKNWVHKYCVQMSASAFRVWAINSRTFLCRKCCFIGNTYDAEAGLERSMENVDDSSDIPAFQLQNTNLSNRSKDVFSSLDTLEQQHNAFERSRAREDADSDRRLIHESTSDEETNSVHHAFKRPSSSGRDYQQSKKGGRHGHDRTEQQFRKPMPPPTQSRGRYSTRGRYSRGRATPDYTIHPDRWTEYSLEDVDISDTANKRAALYFLHERRKLEQETHKEDVMDLESKACSKGEFTFKQRTKATNSVENSSAEKPRIDSSYECMEDDNDSTELSEEDVACPIVSKNSNSLKRKLEDIDISDETVSDAEKQTSFKSRKVIKRSFRSQKDRDDDTIE